MAGECVRKRFDLRRQKTAAGQLRLCGGFKRDGTVRGLFLQFGRRGSADRLRLWKRADCACFGTHAARSCRSGENFLQMKMDRHEAGPFSCCSDSVYRQVGVSVVMSGLDVLRAELVLLGDQDIDARILTEAASFFAQHRVADRAQADLRPHMPDLFECNGQQ